MEDQEDVEMREDIYQSSFTPVVTSPWISDIQVFFNQDKDALYSVQIFSIDGRLVYSNQTQYFRQYNKDWGRWHRKLVPRCILFEN